MTMPEIDPDKIVRQRLGPPPLELLATVIQDFGDMSAVALVLQDREGNLVVASGGASTLETAGMFQYGVYMLSSALGGMAARFGPSDEESEKDDDEGNPSAGA